MCLSALAQTAVGSRSGRTRTGAVAGHCEWERPAARKYGPIDLDQHLLVVLLELREPTSHRRGNSAQQPPAQLPAAAPVPTP